ncbi:MAG TPA: amidohydrolase family protein, partial [Pilimelia sp.]|nr:amidohydrolase family protein [Pilimelia sp.]
MGERIHGRVVTPAGVIAHGYLETAGDRIAAVGPAGTGAPRRPPTGWLVPGFVDLHCHGGGGHSFVDGDPAAARAAAAYHRGHGTTTLLASLVTAPVAALAAATRALGPLVDAGVLAGLHYEGPYLARARRGAHDPAHLRDPAEAELRSLLALVPGAVRMVTLAPELPGAAAAIELLAGAGVVPAIGHTAASYAQTRAAVAAGARVATHLFNGMPPVHHRQPGPVAALLTAPEVVCELIADGVHLDDGALALAVAAAGPDRTALVTDAIAAAG